MAVSQLSTSDRTVQDSRAFLQWLLADYHPRDFAVRFWDGSRWEPEDGQPTRYTLVLQHPGAVRSMFWPPKGLTLAEAYLFNDFDVEGELEGFWLVAKHLREKKWGLMGKAQFAAKILRLPSERRPRVGGPRQAQLEGSTHSQQRDREAVTYHYNVSNDFYALFLDRHMVYTCSYFGTPADSIDASQEHKLDHVCKKLRLKPGDRILDVGCGWGAFSIYAVKNYGVEALGVTISQPQVDFANERIRKEGLTGRCRVENLDYRAVKEPRGFDKIAAMGIHEHVGEKMLPSYFQQAWDLLKPGGVFLSHGIALNMHQEIPKGTTFSQKYVFPDGELLPISKNLHYAEKTGFEVRDVESLRDHYLLTCRHWLRRLEENADEARRLTDDVTYRIYRLYLAISALGFRLGRINLYQALLLKSPNGESGLPLTRDDWYA